MQEDDFDSAAMPLSVLDPGFIAPHLLLSMSMPTNGAGFGRGVFRPVSDSECSEQESLTPVLRGYILYYMNPYACP